MRLNYLKVNILQDEMKFPITYLKHNIRTVRSMHLMIRICILVNKCSLVLLTNETFLFNKSVQIQGLIVSVMCISVKNA